jgi:hypothetical protein
VKIWVFKKLRITDRVSEIWLQWWTVANETRPNENIGYWLGVYGAMGFLILFSAFIANWYVENNPDICWGPS